MAKRSLSMKLLVDTQTKTVLFAEANKDCVDFLFYILSLPLATVIALLKKQGMVGSLGKLYDSIQNLNDCYLQSTDAKRAILNPVVPNHAAAASSFPLLLGNQGASTEQKNFYRCGYTPPKGRDPYDYGGYTQPVSSGIHDYITDDPRTPCPQCNGQMATGMTYAAPPPPEQQEWSIEDGYVQGVVTYMVMDDLEVKPMSTISSLTLLNKFKVKDVGSLQEKIVTVGMVEAEKLLKASLQSEHVLTDVFIKGMEVEEIKPMEASP